jgi:hypothetical protein
MYEIPPYEAGVTLHRLDGTTTFYPTRRRLLKALGWHALRFTGPRLDESLGWHIVILDDAHRALSAMDFKPLTTYKPSAYQRRQSLADWSGTGPVPRTGRRRGGSAYRHVRTQAERRANVFIYLDEQEPPARAARSCSNLASLWDDLVRSDCGLRSWKHYRSHQWKS